MIKQNSSSNNLQINILNYYNNFSTIFTATDITYVNTPI